MTTKSAKRSTIRKIPPLPFQGNKSIGRKVFLEVLEKVIDGNNKTFVDLFGGSFYLSYLIHKTYPNAKVICNDFDNYRQRLENIEITKDLIKQIKEVVKEERFKKITPETKEKIDTIIRNCNGFVDLITLSSNLLYSSFTLTELEPFLNHEYYNLLIKSEYNSEIADYLEGIEFVSCDWKELFEQYKDKENVIFIADPPYLYTDRRGYMYHNEIWDMKKNLEVLQVLEQDNFIYYCSGKSGVIDFINYLKDEIGLYEDFDMIPYRRGKINKRTRCNKEIMLYRLDLIDDEEEDFEEEDFEDENEPTEKVDTPTENVDTPIENVDTSKE